MQWQLNVSTQSKDHVPQPLGSLCQSHTGLSLVLEIVVKWSEHPAWRVLGEKHYWDKLIFLKSLSDFPQTRRLSGQVFLHVWTGLKNLHSITAINRYCAADRAGIYTVMQPGRGFAPQRWQSAVRSQTPVTLLGSCVPNTSENEASF